jgi:hypothetical protein
VQVSDGTPNNVAVPSRLGIPERAKFPQGDGLDSNQRALRLTQPEHGMNKPLPKKAVPIRVKGWRAVNLAKLP